MFNAVDTDHSGKITAKELQAALQNGKGQGFSDKCCQLMICKSLILKTKLLNDNIMISIRF